MIILIFGTRQQTSELAHVCWHSVARIALPRADANTSLFIDSLAVQKLRIEEEFCDCCFDDGVDGC